MAKSDRRAPNRLFQKILREPLAQQRLNSLRDRGVDVDFIADQLVLIPFASAQVPPLVAGLDLRGLRKFPEELDAMAWKVERVIASPHIKPRTVLPQFRGSDSEPIRTWETQGVLEKKAIFLTTLPETLRNLAEYLRLCLRI